MSVQDRIQNAKRDTVTFTVGSDFAKNLREIVRTQKAITPTFMKSTLRRNSKVITDAMKANSKSDRISKMIGVTTAEKWSGEYGAKIGVIKNDVDLFPTFTAPALASVIEYGTKEERFRKGRFGIITSKGSTGRVPARPFLRPAWDSTVNTFMRKTEDSIDRKIMREMKQ